ncbi:MAG: hypothetical protein ACK55I_10235, partial [bacterium]
RGRRRGKDHRCPRSLDDALIQQRLDRPARRGVVTDPIDDHRDRAPAEQADDALQAIEQLKSRRHRTALGDTPQIDRPPFIQACGQIIGIAVRHHDRPHGAAHATAHQEARHRPAAQQPQAGAEHEPQP